jgi:Bardet-Biedl syndrome 2 protein
VSFLCPVIGPKFAFGLANGTVGVYNGAKTRLWRVKAKNRVTALQSYDLDSDGVPEVISGWSNGAFNVRNESTGEIIFKDTLVLSESSQQSSSSDASGNASVAAILRSDYRLDGKEELIVCTQSGDIRGYLPTDVEVVAMAESGAKYSSTAVSSANLGDQKLIADLQAKKLELANELRLLEKSLKANRPGQDSVSGALPPNTVLSYSLLADMDSKSVALTVEASTDVLLTNIVIIDSGSDLKLIYMIIFRSIVIKHYDERWFCPFWTRDTRCESLISFKNSDCLFETCEKSSM